MQECTVPLCACLVIALPAAGIDRPQAASPPREVTVTLAGRAADLGNELVNFGLPLPPGFLYDPAMLRVSGEDGAEIQAAVRSLEKAVYESQPQFYISANLNIPTTGRPPYPGVLFQMGDTTNGKPAIFTSAAARDWRVSDISSLASTRWASGSALTTPDPRLPEAVSAPTKSTRGPAARCC
jgi:hypothetical protein